MGCFVNADKSAWPWGHYAALAVGAAFLFVGASGALFDAYILSELGGEPETMFVLKLIQSLMVVGLGVVFLMTAKSYGGAQVPHLKPAVVVFSLAILATAALNFNLNSEFEEGAYLAEAILLTLVGLGGLVAVKMTGKPSPNLANGLIIGAASAILLFIVSLTRDSVLNEYAEIFMYLGLGASGFIPGLVGHGTEAVFKLLAIMAAAVAAAAWPMAREASGRAITALILYAAGVMLAIGLLIGAVGGLGGKPLSNLDGAPELIVTSQVMLFLSFLVGLAAALLIGGATITPGWTALNHLTSQPQRAGTSRGPLATRLAGSPPAAVGTPETSEPMQSPPSMPTPSAGNPVKAPIGGRLMKCPKCRATVAVEAGEKPACPECWYGV